VANPEEALVEVYTKLELPIDGFAIESIQRHIGRHLVPEGIKTDDYQSTYKVENYNPNLWKSELKSTQIRELEKQCNSTLQFFHYDLHN
jgi:hypothetical protein